MRARLLLCLFAVWGVSLRQNAVLAQAAATSAEVVHRLKWWEEPWGTHTLSVASPELSLFSAVRAAYSYRPLRNLIASAEFGPALRHPELRDVAPALWGVEWGLGVEAGIPFAGMGWSGLYAQARVQSAGFAYRGYELDPTETFRVAGPRERARFRQQGVELGGSMRFYFPGAGIYLAGEAGVFVGRRGVFAETPLYPDPRTLPPAGLETVREHGVFHRELGLRGRIRLEMWR